MDCNKEIAIKAKAVAEKKLADLDIVGAKKFATIAQNLYPELDGLSQLHTTLNVYLSVQRRTNGEIDWYKVLRVEPSADDDTIRQHYLKLAVGLHPDRNQSVGVNGAFKLISRAWSLLSNKAERTVYDEKLNTSSAAGRDVINDIARNDGSDSRNWRSVPQCRPPLSTRPVKNTFWAMCGACKVQFEYLRTYLNRTLICSNCSLSFLAVEIPAPPLDSGDSFSLGPNMLQTSNDAESTSSSGSKLGTAGYMGTNESWRKPFPSVSLFGSASSDVIGPTFGQMKKKHKSASRSATIDKSFHSEAYPFEKSIFTHGSSIPKELQLKKTRRITKPIFNGRCRDLGEPRAAENVGTSNGRSLDFHKHELGRVRIGGNNQSIYRREFTQHEVRNMLVEKARSEIRKKLKEWKLEEMPRNIEKLPASNKIMSNTDKELDASTGLKENADSKNGLIFERSCQNSGENSVFEGSDPFSMTVPDPDFHDFDKDRTEKSFCSNQIWAVYDDDDGMPRYYAMIHNVISLKPFKMRISWLNSKTNTELSPLNWVGCGFPKTSGEFWIGKSEVNGYLNSFSHKISWIKGSRGVVHIYPKKGEVWALYRNWSPEWNQFTPDEIIHKYDMVEVIEDYNEERGVVIVPLVKVDGFNTVFRQHLDANQKREIPRAEMFRFSHQIPSYLLTGIEGRNAPAGCRELDPAATPLQEAKETQERNTGEVAESAKIEIPQDVKNGDGRNAEGDAAMKKETKTEERTTKVYRRKRSREQENACG